MSSLHFIREATGGPLEALVPEQLHFHVNENTSNKHFKGNALLLKNMIDSVSVSFLLHEVLLTGNAGHLLMLL